METAFQIVSLSVVCAVACVLIRERSGSLAMLLALTACVSALLLAVRFFGPIISLMERLRNLSGLSETVTAPLMKIIGLGLLTQLAGGVCEDSGEKALAKTVEICGSILAVYVSLPLINGVLTLLETMLGG